MADVELSTEGLAIETALRALTPLQRAALLEAFRPELGLPLSTATAKPARVEIRNLAADFVPSTVFPIGTIAFAKDTRQAWIHDGVTQHSAIQPIGGATTLVDARVSTSFPPTEVFPAETLLYETDTRRLRVADGVLAYSALQPIAAGGTPVDVRAATVLDYVAKTPIPEAIGHGLADAKARTFQSYVATDNVLRFTWPDAASPDLGRCLVTTCAAGPFVVKLKAPPAGVYPPGVEFRALVTNAGGAAAPIYVGLSDPTETPILFDAAYAAARPSIAAGETVVVVVRTAYHPGGAVAYLTVERITAANVRKRPLLRPAPAGNPTRALATAASSTTQLENEDGDLIVCIIPRANATPAAAPTAVPTNLAPGPFVDSTSGLSVRICWTIATAPDVVVTNTSGVTWFRPMFAVFGDADPTTPFPDAPIFQQNAIAATPWQHPTPANVHTDPIAWLAGIVCTGSHAWATPAELDPVALNASGALGMLSPRLSAPAINFAGPSAALRSIAFALAVQGEPF